MEILSWGILRFTITMTLSFWVPVFKWMVFDFCCFRGLFLLLNTLLSGSRCGHLDQPLSQLTYTRNLLPIEHTCLKMLHYTCIFISGIGVGEAIMPSCYKVTCKSVGLKHPRPENTCCMLHPMDHQIGSCTGSSMFQTVQATFDF